jgi:tetratricopeptide (TPR) repeat protein
MSRAAVLLVLAACAGRAPDAKELYHEAMQRYAANGRAAEALERLDRSLALQPDYVEARLARAGLLARAGRPEEAMAEYADILRRSPGHRDALTGRAMLQLSLGRGAAAIADADELVKQEPDVAEGFLLRGWIHRELGRPGESFVDFRRAQDLAHDLWPRYYNAGVGALTARRFDDARRMFVLATALAPEQPDPYVGLARLNVEQGRFAEAVDDYAQALERRENPEHRYHRANALLALRRIAEALKDYDGAVELEPHAARYRYGRALARLAADDRDGALDDLNRCLKADPMQREALLQRAMLLHSMKRLDGAEADYTAALKIEATADSVRRLARLYQDKEDWDRAVYYLEAAMRLCPGDEALRRSLADELDEVKRRKNP